MCAKLTKEEFFGRKNKLKNGVKMIGEYIDTTTPTEFQCNVGHVWSATPFNVYMNGSGCPYCAGKKVLVGFNDLWTTRPDIARLLKNPEDGYKYTKGSGKKVDFICPDCGAPNNKNINMVCRYGFACNRCSDGVSYPNKFGRSVLEQLCGDNFQCEYQPEWAKPYFYDNYFEHGDKKYVLEMDGVFHYQESKYSSYSLERQMKVDAVKDKLAIDHKIEVIRIDCVKSECDYIKNNILCSKLNDIFDLSKVNWSLCDAKAQKSLIQEVCNLYNEGMHDLNEIKNKLHISLWAAQKYVKIGSEVGWCDYTIERAKREGREKIMVRVNVVDENNNIIHRFNGVRRCADDMTNLYNIYFNTPNIIKSCKTHKPYKGFNFRYAEAHELD